MSLGKDEVEVDADELVVEDDLLEGKEYAE